MSNLLGQLEVAVRAIVGRDLDTDLSKAKDKAAKAGTQMADAVAKETEGISRTIGDRLGTIGPMLTKTLTPIAGTLTAAFAGIGSSWRSAGKEMQTTTGAVGDELSGLMHSVRDVAGTAKGGVGVIADVMADLAVKTKLTGDPLENLTQRLLLLREIGQQVTAADVGAAFGKWAVPTDQWAGALERLYKIAQETGITVPTLLGRLADFEPTLKALGYNFDQATLLAARLPDTVLPALKAALADATTAQAGLADNQLKAEQAQVAYTDAVAKHGEASLEARTKAAALADVQALVAAGSKDIASSFAGQIQAVHDAATADEAMRLGMEAFGTKAGPAMVDAIRTNKFELGGLSDAVAASTTSIQKTAEDHRTWADQLALVKDKITAVAGPLATHAATLSTIAAGAGPIVQGVTGLARAMGILGPAATAGAAGQAAMAAANTAEGVTAAAAVAPTASLAAGIWAVAAPVLAVIAVVGLLVAAGYLLIKNWDDVKAGAGVVWGWIQGFIGGVVGFLIDHWTLLLGPLGLIIDQWQNIKSVAGEVWGWVEERISGFVDFVTGIPRAVGGALSGLWEGLTSGFTAAWNAIARTVNGIDFTIPSWVPGLGGKTFGLPDLPILDQGGILTGPGLWAKADYRPEVVAPLDELAAMFDSRGDHGPPGGDTYIIHGSILAERQLLALVDANASKKRRYNVSSGLG